ncbi:hypothetical protein RHG44_15635 [Clostridioides difficile]|nr:hypothetical protein [Clostridioides difficile]
MNNYLKFATYQLIGFTSSIPRLIKIKKNPDKFSLKEKFELCKNKLKNL